MKRGTKIALWIGLFTTLLALLTLTAVALLWWQGEDMSWGDTEEVAWMKVVLKDTIPTAPSPDQLVFDPSDIPLTLYDYTSAIRKAAKDPDIQGLAIELSNLSIGLSAAYELSQAIKAFRAEGKPCRVWSKTYENGSYYLANACGDIALYTNGVPFVTGLQVSTSHYVGLMEQVGVTADYEKVGLYKSAPETFEERQPTDRNREMMESLLESLHSSFVAQIAEGRAVTPAEVEAWLASPPVTAASALSSGMVDRLSSREDWWAEGTADDPARVDQADGRDGTAKANGTDPDGEAASGEGEEEQADEGQLVEQGAAGEAPASAPEGPPRTYVALKSYRERGGTSGSSWSQGLFNQTEKGVVAIVFLSGQIIDGNSAAGGLGGDAIGDLSVIKQLKELEEDKAVKAVVLRVDSPGGSALASDMMWEAIRRLDKHKPVVVSMGAYAASGGYYISMPARYIVAAPTTLTGSIGVYGGKFSLRGAYDKLGITTWSAKRGGLAGIYSSPDPFTPEERVKIRERIEDFYTVFITKAAQGRDLPVEAIDAVAQGRVWTGAQAKEVGLVDEIGDLEVAVEKAWSLSGESGDFSRRILPRIKTLYEILMETGDSNSFLATPGASEGALPEELSTILTPLIQASVMDRIVRQGDLLLMPAFPIVID